MPAVFAQYSVRIVSPGNTGLVKRAPQATQPLRVIRADCADELLTRDSERAQSMQDGAVEAGLLRDRGIGMQGIVVAAQPVDQRSSG